jgi:hypothetical protein
MSGDASLKLTIQADTRAASENVKALSAAVEGAGGTARHAGAALAGAGRDAEKLGTDASQTAGAVDGLSDSAGSASTALGGLAQQTDKTGSSAEVTGKKTRELTDEEKKSAESAKQAEVRKEALNRALMGLAQGMGGTIGRAVAFIASMKDMAQSGGAAGVAILGTTAVLNGLKSALSTVRDYVKGSAEDGNKNAQAMVGAAKHIDYAFGNLVTTLTDSIAPAFAGLAEIVSEVIDTLAKETAGTNILRDASANLVETLLSVIQIMIEMRALAQKPVPGTGWIAELRGWKPEIDETNGLLGKLEDRLATLSVKLRAGGQDVADLVDRESRWAAGKGRLIEKLQEQLTAEEYTHKQRLAIIQTFYEQNKDVIEHNEKATLAIRRMMRQESVAIQKEDAKARLDVAKAAADAEKEATAELRRSIAERLSSYKGDKAEQLRIVQERIADLEAQEGKHTEVLRDLYSTRTGLIRELDEEEHQETVKRQEERQKDAEERQKKADEAWLKAQQDAAALRREMLDEDLAQIDLYTTSEAEAIERRIEAIQRELEVREHTAARRKELNKMLAAEEKKQTALELAEHQKRNAAILTMTQSAVAQLIDERRKGANVLIEIATKYASDQLNILSSQVAQELAVYQSMVQSHGAEVAKKALLDKGGMAASLAAAFAPLGPFAVPATAAAIALMSALVNKFASNFKFASGGSPFDRLSGLVPGPAGAGDIIPAMLAPREFVVRESSAAPPQNKAFLDDFNQTGDLAGAAARAGVSTGSASGGSAMAPTGGSVEVRISFAEIPTDREIVRLMMGKMNAEVLQRGGELVASHGNFQLRRP